MGLVLLLSQHKCTYFWTGLILWNNCLQSKYKSGFKKMNFLWAFPLQKVFPFKRFLFTGQLENFLCRKHCILDFTLCIKAIPSSCSRHIKYFSCFTFFNLHPSIWLSACSHCKIGCFPWTINCEHSSSYHVWKHPGLQRSRPVVLILSKREEFKPW